MGKVKGTKDDALNLQLSICFLSSPSGVSQNTENRVKITQSHGNLNVFV